MTFHQHLTAALHQRPAVGHAQPAVQHAHVQLLQRAHDEAQAARFAEQAATHQALRDALATYRLKAAQQHATGGAA